MFSLKKRRQPLASPVLALLLLALSICACARGPSVNPPPGTIPAPTPTPHWEQAPFSARLEPVANGFSHPSFLYAPFDGTSRLFVGEQEGRIRIVQDGRLLDRPFLDLRDRVATLREQALQGMVFAPDFATSKNFYVTYNRASDGALVLERYRVSADPNVADATGGTEILVIPNPVPDHEGGALLFDDDGYLLLSVGDGNDPTQTPNDNSRRLDTLPGKLLRLDVSSVPYKIPQNNPFVKDPNARPEIWAYGLRNPWRMFHDKATGDFYIADVGHWRYDEVNVLPSAEVGGKNFGWPRMEASHCFMPDENCRQDALTLPVFEYPHAYGCAIIGGVVYRGARIPELQNSYLFGDLCSGRVWAMRRDETGERRVLQVGQWDINLTAIAGGEDGELYLADYTKGVLYRLVIN